MPTVFERVRAVVADKLSKDLDEITENSHFKNDLGADSLEIVEMIMTVEEEFSIPNRREIKITDDDHEEVQTVGKLVAWLKKRGVKDHE